MTTQSTTTETLLSEETVSSLQELLRGLNDSVEYLNEAAKKIDDSSVAQTFNKLSSQRQEIASKMEQHIDSAGECPEDDGSWLGSLRQCWTAFRAGLNSGDATVVLIEAERAEDALMAKFKEILPEVAGTPINDKLLQAFETIKGGHDEVLALRNAHQAT